MKLRTVLVITALLGGLLAPVAAAPDAVAATAPPGVVAVTSPPDLSDPTVMPDYTSWTSTVWSGWADVVNAGVHLRYAYADMFVPTVRCAENGEEAAFWVGLDGAIDQSKTVEQTGIIAYCNGATAEYYSFWEMYPQGPVTVGQVSPNDDIEMSVYYRSSDGEFDLSLTDLANKNADIYEPNFCPAGRSCLRSSAEFIAEDSGGPPGHQLPDFGTTGFYGVVVTSQDGTRGTLEANSLWGSDEVTMKYDGTVMAQPASRTDGSTAFNDTWHNPG
jgi:hypothetical protein